VNHFYVRYFPSGSEDFESGEICRCLNMRTMQQATRPLFGNVPEINTIDQLLIVRPDSHCMMWVTMDSCRFSSIEP
jgi:hypothetical protein